MNRTYLSLLPEFAIAGSMIYIYTHRLILILGGRSFPTTTGMDALLTEMMSAVSTIVLISFWIIFFRSSKKNFLKLVLRLSGLIFITGAIVLLMIYSGGKGFLDLTLLYVLGGATLLKLIKYAKNHRDHAGAVRDILGYVFIYAGCFVIAVFIDLNIFEHYLPMSVNTDNPVGYLDQSALKIDVLAALIYYFSIGIMGPIITTARRKKKPSLIF